MRHFPRILSGFTLVELMVTIAIAAILLAIATPSFNDATLGSKLAASANDLVAGVALGRSEAIKRNAPTQMCVSSDGSTCGSGDWSQGWIVLAGNTLLEKHAEAPMGLKLQSSVEKIDFQPTGVGSTPATIKVCRATPDVGSQERLVSISATGRAYVSKTTTGTCN